MPIQELAPSIWKIESGNPGPSVAILGGTHGNERTGIEVVKRLSQDFLAGTRTLTHGTLYLVLGNLRAIEMNERSSGEERDMNRMYTKERFDQAPDGSYEDGRAREITSLVLDHADIAIDIHSDNKPSVPFLACSASQRHEAVYRWFTTDKNVTDPEYLLGGKPVTTDEYVDLQGGIGICYETGYAQDISRVDEVEENLLNILRDQGMLTDKPLPVAPPKKEVYKIVDRIMVPEEGFRYAEGMGKESFQSFNEGDTIGFIGETPYVAKHDGYLIFPKPEHLFWKGTPVTWIAVKA